MCAFWVRVDNVPLVRCDAQTTKVIGNVIGEFLEFDDDEPLALSSGLRIRTMIGITKSLRRVVRLAISRTETRLLGIKYDRLPSYSFVCGRLGHSHKGCEFSEEEKESSTVLEYGPWLQAEQRGRDEIFHAEKETDRKRITELYNMMNNARKAVTVHVEPPHGINNTNEYQKEKKKGKDHEKEILNGRGKTTEADVLLG